MFLDGWARPGRGAFRLAYGLILLLSAFGAGCGIFGSPKVPPPEVPPPVVAAPTPEPEPHLLLSLKERRLYVVENDVKQPPLEGYRVAVGRPQFPTPTGSFQINEMVEHPDFVAFDFNNPKAPDRGRIPPGPNNPLGLRWIGFAAMRGWGVGFHGTAKTSVLGQAVSHGCVRMSNPDVVEVYDRVKIGTVVVVEP